MRYFLVLSLVLLGCTDGDDGASFGETQSSVVVNNRLAANRLAANRLAANRLAANRLAANELSIGRLELNSEGAGELIKTAEGRELISYIVSCALSPEQTLIGTDAGTTYEFPGEIGLATSWAHHRLNTAGKGWISACLFARVNAHNVAIPVSLRGSHRNLAATADERANWTVEEGAFYGDLFQPENKPIIWIACRGKGQAAGETGGLTERDCAEPDPLDPTKTQCGFTYAGDCGTFAPKQACESYSGGVYDKCHATSAVRTGHHHGFGQWGDHDDDDDDQDDDVDEGGGGHHHDATYRQVITTYVIP